MKPIINRLVKRNTVSVIIPTYKETQYIHDAINSLLNQEGNIKVQILIGVNGSNFDWYQKLLNYYSLTNNVEIYYTKTAGISAGRNIALKHAKGKYITFLDDDDFLSENFLADSIKLFKRGVDVVCVPLIDCSIDGCPLEHGKDNYINKAMKAQTRRSEYVLEYEVPPNVVTTVWGKIYRHSVIKAMTPFREDVLVSEDVIFWAEKSTEVKGFFRLMNLASSKSWYMRRLTPNSMSRVDDDEKFIRERMNVVNELKKILEGDCNERLVKSHMNSQLRLAAKRSEKT